MTSVPLFPLRTVLFPGGPLPLRIFEARYLDMISGCLKSDSPFGVVLIREGAETGPSTTYSVGTLARVVDWYQGSDGLLGVTAIGERRFRLLSEETRPDGLRIGRVELLDEPAPLPLPEEYAPLADILGGILDDLGRLYENLERRYDDAGWVACRYAEVLPIDVEQKQMCLELDDPVARLGVIRDVISEVKASAARGE